MNGENFQQLMNHAIKSCGEEAEVWNYFENQRVKDSLLKILVSEYKLAKSNGSDHLLSVFQNRVTSGSEENLALKKKIEKGIALQDLVKEIYDKIKIAKAFNQDEKNALLDRYLNILNNIYIIIYIFNK